MDCRAEDDCNYHTEWTGSVVLTMVASTMQTVGDGQRTKAAKYSKQHA